MQNSSALLIPTDMTLSFVGYFLKQKYNPLLYLRHSQRVFFDKTFDSSPICFFKICESQNLKFAQRITIYFTHCNENCYMILPRFWEYRFSFIR